MKHILKPARLLMLVLTLSAPLIASAHDDDNNWHGGGNWNPPSSGGGRNVPLDGGLSLLLAAGVGYGIKRYAQNKKSEK